MRDVVIVPASSVYHLRRDCPAIVGMRYDRVTTVSMPPPERRPCQVCVQPRRVWVRNPPLEQV